jgi:hypothetical protein
MAKIAASSAGAQSDLDLYRSNMAHSSAEEESALSRACSSDLLFGVGLASPQMPMAELDETLEFVPERQLQRWNRITFGTAPSKRSMLFWANHWPGEESGAIKCSSRKSKGVDHQKCPMSSPISERINLSASGLPGLLFAIGLFFWSLYIK